MKLAGCGTVRLLVAKRVQARSLAGWQWQSADDRADAGAAVELDRASSSDLLGRQRSGERKKREDGFVAGTN
jgi:hypothetical protein